MQLPMGQPTYCVDWFLFLHNCERSELSGHIDRCATVHRYCACAVLRANVAGWIGNRVSPAESAFSACMGLGLNSLPGGG